MSPIIAKPKLLFSILGDLLRVNLRSTVDNSLLFSAPVYTSIVAARPSRRRDEETSPDSLPVEKPPLPSNQWEVRKSSPTHIAVGVPRNQLPLHRFWPTMEGNGSTDRDNDEDDDEGRTSGAPGKPTDDQLDHSAETAISQWKRGWNHPPETLEAQQVETVC